MIPHKSQGRDASRGLGFPGKPANQPLKGVAKDHVMITAEAATALSPTSVMVVKAHMGEGAAAAGMETAAAAAGTPVRAAKTAEAASSAEAA